MKIPTRVQPLIIGFERLESEPDPRSVAQRVRRLKAKSRKAPVAGKRAAR